jgi:hypothetical protein
MTQALVTKGPISRGRADRKVPEQAHWEHPRSLAFPDTS